MNEIDIKREGYEAARSGKSIVSNPYRNIEVALLWDEGHHRYTSIAENKWQTNDEIVSKDLVELREVVNKFFDTWNENSYTANGKQFTVWEIQSLFDNVLWPRIRDMNTVMKAQKAR